MNEEINIRQIFSEFVHFNKRNKSLIFVFILAGIVSVILFQNLKPAYYETKAICMSGISEYERLEQLEELSQRTAVDLINYLQINIANKDYGQLSELLSIDKDMTEKIKHIEAEQLYQQDMNEKYYALNKFEISLSVFDNTIIDDVQKGLINYFNNNSFIKQYHKMYIDGNNRLINEIDKEIKDGVIPDPNAVDPITGEPLPAEGEMGMMGDVPVEPEIDGGLTDAQVQKDTKKAEI